MAEQGAPPPAALVISLRQALAAAGLPSDDPEAAATAERVATLWWEQWVGLRQPIPALVPLPSTTEEAELVLVRDVPFQSTCLHHLTPIVGTMDFAYLPDRWLIGIGAPALLLHHFAARPTLQERLTTQLADQVMDRLAPKGVLVHLRARHGCMSVRGARAPGLVETVAARGALRHGPLRAEFFTRLGLPDRGDGVEGIDG